MIRLCVFRDRDLWHKPDISGFNKVGYLTDKDTVVYPVRRHFVEVPLAKVLKRKKKGTRLGILKKDCPEYCESKIECFFTDNVLNPGLMRLGHRMLREANFAYFDNPIRLPKLKPISANEHRRRWTEMMISIQRGDLVQVLDTSSCVSRLIARIDLGTWSHSARYIGNGNVFEVITSGAVTRSISSYADRHYRVGIYRAPNLSDDDLARMDARDQSVLGKSYAWRTVLILGWKKILRLEKYKSYEVSPNDLLSRFDFRLIYLV